MTDKKKKLIAGGGIALFLIIVLTVFLTAGRPMLAFLSDPAAVRAWAEGGGVWSRLAFAGMMVLQIFVAIIPGEPLEICAGYAFGVWEGTALCMAGALVGSALVFLVVRTLGVKAAELFFSRDKLNELSFLKDERRLNLTVFILFFIPGTPKDIISYFIGLTRMKLVPWLAISGVARIPSIVTSTIGGDALGVGDTTFAIIVFAATLVISAAGMIGYNTLVKTRGRKIRPVN